MRRGHWVILVDILIAEAPTERFSKWSAHPGVELSLPQEEGRGGSDEPRRVSLEFFTGTVHLSTPLVYV